MIINESKNFCINVSTNELKSALTIDRALDFVTSLMDNNESLINIETEEHLTVEHVAIAQDVLRMLFVNDVSNWKYWNGLRPSLKANFEITES